MANTIDIVVPDLGDFDKVEVIEVLVSSGDTVAREDGLVTIETDKASMDIPSPENGVVEKLTIDVGDSVSAGDVIGQLRMEVGDTVVITPAMASEPTGDTTVLTGEAPKPPGKPPLEVRRSFSMKCAQKKGQPRTRPTIWPKSSVPIPSDLMTR